MMDLQVIWFILITVLFTGFFLLEGFDYGVGALLPFLSSRDDERTQVLRTIAPIWDGNEVWMITAGGALFAAFPHVYATMFSTFYLALFLMLVALILRGVAFEMRVHTVTDARKRLWDGAICFGSAVPAFLWGVAVTDLIAGLPRDTVEGFRYTLDAVLAMDPENITVHTLALKKGSRLMMERQGLPSGEETARMLDYAWETLARAGYRPYYLYRQKYMSGALENIGWCKPGFEGLYNVCIMEELHSIVALGAGGSTKLTDPDTGKIVRITNPKYPYEYIGRIEAICREKEDIVPFYRALLSK